MILPKVNLNIKFDDVDTERSPIIDSSDDEDIIAPSPQPKKIHHNPFLKSSSSIPAVKKNVSMLNKLQQLCRTTDDDLKETRSGYVYDRPFILVQNPRNVD